MHHHSRFGDIPTKQFVKYRANEFSPDKYMHTRMELTQNNASQWQFSVVSNS